MAVRRTLWLSAQLLCLVFYWAYREWLSWLLLMAAVCLPWLSLLLSLPAMLTCRIALRAPEAVTLGQEAFASCLGSALFPLPRFRSKLQVTHSYTEKTALLPSGSRLPTAHCGCLELRPRWVWVQDYLGVFRLPLPGRVAARTLVRPVPVEMDSIPDLQRYLVNAWRPKAGGGFSENHELRLYRPGDNLRQIHWKLSAKTGTYILREPMEALRERAVITLELSGDPDVLDRKLGQLLWTSDYLLEKGVVHEVHCLTGRGMESFSITGEGSIITALDTLLTAPPVSPEVIASYSAASWRCHIGGDGHEA